MSGGPTAATGAGWALFANRGSVLLSWTEGGATKSLLFPANDPATQVPRLEAELDARPRAGDGDDRAPA